MDALSTKPKPVSMISAILRSRRMRGVLLILGCVLFSYYFLLSGPTSSSSHLDLNGEGEPMDIDQKDSLLSEDPYTALEKRIQALIDTHHVMVFSKTYCPFSKAAKELLHSYTDDFRVLEVDLDPKNADIKKILTKISHGHSTFPSIFFDGESIGGRDNLVALDSKHQLKPRLEALGVTMLQ
ncbi:hypothetical protein BGZ83_005518 [Gryganskiella cystojenkinii]|nr:hypothetical protein BGZ83_005518 [Gryganskiella cystojenkinii]